jgi:molecular chaperone IbpA
LPSYPPYNIKAVGKDKYVIEMAVAGFAKTDIEVSLQGNKLTVQGSTSEEDTNEVQDYIFKGIANRNFTRTFNLADKIEIKDAEIVNGMLKIWLDSLVETQANIKKIAIK